MRALWWVAAACLLAGCSADLVADLDGAEANEVIVALEQRGIPSSKEAADDGAHFTITVGKSRLTEAIAALAAAELPRARRPGVQAAFASASLVPTPLEERARLAAATSADLERTLEVLPAVERARVHLAVDIGGDLFAPATKPSASVVLRLRARGDVNPDDVKRIVAASWSGLEPARIELITTRATPADPARAAAANSVALGLRERSVYVALTALAFVVLLGLALYYVSRRPVAVTAPAPTPIATIRTRPQPG